MPNPSSHTSSLGASLRRGRFGRIALLASAISLSACQTTDPYTGETEVNKTTWGAGIGAATGAAVGALVDGGDGALVGAGAGALAGGGIGYYMDRQDAKLRQQLRGSGVSVTRAGNNIILNMPGDVTFATNSADISASFYRVLDSVALVIKEFDQTNVSIVGHTDSTGSDQYNQGLSERRAQSVSAYLQGRGVSPARLYNRGMGESQPIASNDTTSGRARNRRVEITLTPSA